MRTETSRARQLILIAVVGVCSIGGALAQAANSPSDKLKSSMESGMRSMQGMKLSGDTDKDFAMMMKMHHQQAIEMAKVEMQSGTSAQLKAMAQKMIDDQSKEIGELDAWLQQHK